MPFCDPILSTAVNRVLHGAKAPTVSFPNREGAGASGGPFISVLVLSGNGPGQLICPPWDLGRSLTDVHSPGHDSTARANNESRALSSPVLPNLDGVKFHN